MTIEDELRQEARCRRDELDFDGDLKLEDMLLWRAADLIKEQASKLQATLDRLKTARRLLDLNALSVESELDAAIAFLEPPK